MKLRTKLYLAFAILILTGVIVGGMGFYAADKSRESLESIYLNDTISMEQLKSISDMYNINIDAAIHEASDGKLDFGEAYKRIADAQNVIAGKWQSFTGTKTQTDERQLINQAFSLMKKADESILKARNILKGNDRTALRAFIDAEYHRDVEPVTVKLSDLIDMQVKTTNEELVKNNLIFDKSKVFSVVLLIFGLSLSGFIAWRVIDSLFKDLGCEPEYLRKVARMISGGNHSAFIQVDYDKQGSVLWVIRGMFDELNDLIREKDAQNLELTKLSAELTSNVDELKKAMRQVKQLEGIIPICSYCKKIRDDQLSWRQMEEYISAHSEAKFSHGACPDCMEAELRKLRELKKLRKDS